MEHRQWPLELHITTVDYKRKDPVFWIEAITTLTKYKAKQRRFPRYYTELQKLHQHLIATLEDTFIPALPSCPVARYDKEGQLLDRCWWFNVDFAGQPTNRRDTVPLDMKIQRWLDRIARHEHSQQSEGLREFVESEVGFRPHLKRERKLRVKSLATASEHDMEPSFTPWYTHLEETHRHLTQLQLQMERLDKGFKDVARAYVDFTSDLVPYGSMERNPELFITYKDLAKGCQLLSHIEQWQGIAATETLGDEISYQIANNEAAQGSMRRRLHALSDYMSSRKQTEHCLRIVERLKSSVNIDKRQANDAIADLEMARRIERDTEQRYERINRGLQEDLENEYRPSVSQDMLAAVKDYARSQLYLEKQKLAIWQDIARKRN
ncbi:uncharacterized protein BYT42DRAFT_572241 [Radiomyces spectabilis]|uniref:uncharacterized protein n=1 Tax=Radiomyces spectabilis TaxID=64574 RepID=UPI00221F2293|nr:uncharacterized protein BYT42DRAFT_572241 [Radiomyces spectabilis]KAI8377940.1 hypothetical protein BYT42DRAFT_572241 [Radiomyces spectabilis]